MVGEREFVLPGRKPGYAQRMTSVVIIVGVTALLLIALVVRLLGYGAFDRARARRIRRKK